MSQGLLLICFDINSSHEENNKQKNHIENLPESPTRILDEFFLTHKSLKFEKEAVSKSKTSYKFNIKIPELTNVQIITINDLSFIHEICIDADGYLVFINLEDENFEKKLEFLIKYIGEYCSGEIKVYIVGLYKDKILKTFQNEEINLNYEFFKVKYNMNDNNKEHICLYESNNNKNNDVKRSKKIINDEGHEYKLQEIIEKIFINIYEVKMSVIYLPDKKKFVKKGSKNENTSNSHCVIY